MLESARDKSDWVGLAGMEAHESQASDGTPCETPYRGHYSQVSGFRKVTAWAKCSARKKTFHYKRILRKMWYLYSTKRAILVSRP